MSKCVRVKDLIEELKKYDNNLPVIITYEGKDHHYSIMGNDIKVVDYAYFADDNIGKEEFCEDNLFLNLGYF